VRDATPDDAEAVARIQVHAWQEAYAHVFPAEALRSLGDAEAERAAQWRDWLSAPVARSHTLVAVSEGEVVGFVDGRPARDADLDAAHVAELFSIYVSPQHWGTGAGPLLMTAFLDRVRGSRFAEAVLWVLDDNPRARRFYEAAGWAFDGGLKEEEWIGTRVREVRYRIALA
jgi:RimJ/RimL family protein N-acetyltransferase